jgi:hypothetical protein
VVGRAGGVPRECAGQDKQQRGSPRSLDTGGAEEKLWGDGVPSGDDAPVSRRLMLGVPTEPGQ